MASNTYSSSVRKQLVQRLHRFVADAPPGTFDEQALPSYAHANPLARHLFWQRLETALRFAAPQAGHRVLDFGCGAGLLFAPLRKRGCQVVGCDTDLFLARRMCRDQGLTVELTDSLAALPEGLFHTVFALDVLEHIPDIRPLLGCLRSVLQPGGRIILSGPTENRLYRLGRAISGFSGHYHVANIYQIERLFNDAGFRATQLKVLYPLSPLFRVSTWQPDRAV